MGIYDRDYERQDQWRDSYSGGGGVQLRFPQTAVNQIVVVTLVAYLIEVLLFNGPQGGSNRLVPLLGLQPNWWQQPWQVYQLLTYALVHDNHDWFHVAGNMLGVWMFGRELEGRYGYKEFLLFYLGAVLTGGLLITTWDLFEPAGGATIGASAGTVAVIVLFAFLYPHRTVLFMAIFPMPMWVLGVFIVGQDVMRALGPNEEHISFQGHLGGAAFAAAYHLQRWRLAGWLPQNLKAPSLRPRPKLRVHSEPDEDAPRGDDKLSAEVDRILDKINRQGADSLSAKEKRLLQQASKQYKGRRE